MSDFSPYMEDKQNKHKFLLEKKKLEREMELHERMVSKLPPDDPRTTAARQALEYVKELDDKDITALREQYGVYDDSEKDGLLTYDEELEALDKQFVELENFTEYLRKLIPGLDTSLSMEALTETYHEHLEELKKKYNRE